MPAQDEVELEATLEGQYFCGLVNYSG